MQIATFQSSSPTLASTLVSNRTFYLVCVFAGLKLTHARAICLHVRPQKYAHLAPLKHTPPNLPAPSNGRFYAVAVAYNVPGTLDAGGHCVLEMPSGTGKTISLLSLIVAYQQYYPEKRKLVYCSRTMSEIEKALAELKALMKYRTEQLGYEEEFRGLGLTSRKNLCLHPSVKREKSGNIVDARCRSLTAGFVKEKKERGEQVDLCVYHDVCPPGRVTPTCPALDSL